MNTEIFAEFGALYDWCGELRDRLNEAREAMSDEAWEAAMEGPLAEILCAAMDVEASYEKCEDM